MRGIGRGGGYEIEHLPGTPPTEGTLDTPEKRRAYAERMEAATREARERNRRARIASEQKARDRIVF